MRKLLLLLLLAAPAVAQFQGPYLATLSPDAWVRCTEIYIPRENPTCWTSGTPWRASYLATPNVGIAGNMPGIPANVWVPLDVTKLGVPLDAKGVFIHSLAIITHGTTSEIVGGTMSYRRHGSTYDNASVYHTQVCEANLGGGQRTNDSLFCPVENGMIEMFWKPQRATEASWPVGSSVAFSIAVNAWVR